MDEYRLNSADDDLDMEAPETPEDVAVLYTWANVHGGKYRDFSASRREYRAQQRHRQVEAQRQAELEAARAREEAAAREMEEVRRLEEQARHDEAMRAEAEEARRRAHEKIEQDREAAQRHVEVAEELKRALEQAQQEMEDARRRAEEQAARYAEADARYRASARQQLPGEIVDPYYFAGPLEPTAFAPGRGVRSSVPQRVSSEKRIVDNYYRSKGTAEALAASRVDETSYSLFSDGRPRQPSAARRAYTEVESGDVLRDGVPTHMLERMPETTEDARERHRADEVDRLSDHQSGRAFDDNEDDGYYDKSAVRQERSSNPSARNSAADNVFLQPRVQQVIDRRREDELRAREEALAAREEALRLREEAPRQPEPAPADVVREDASARGREYGVREDGPRWRSDSHREREEPVRRREEHRDRAESRSSDAFVPSDDPSPGNVHSLDQARARRRDSAADVNARTARRPRESGVMPNAAEDHSLHATPKEPEVRRATEPTRERRYEAEQRPEWLLRESSAHGEPESTRVKSQPVRRDDDAHREAKSLEDFRQYETRTALRRDDRRTRTDSQMIPAADGGFNLPPMPDSTPTKVERAPRRDEPAGQREVPQRANSVLRDEEQSDSGAQLRDRERMREQTMPKISAAPPVSERGGRENVLPATAGDPVPHRSQAERRRFERSSSERLTRELRVPAAAPAEAPERRLAAEADPGAASVRSGGTHPADTLQQSRERVAARWYALKGLMGGGESSAEVSVARAKSDMPVPILAVVSLSGGVGKTSLVAAVGRSLSSVGERVLLADATPHGLLPYYFGSRELRPDVVRTFSPPPGSKDAPVYMVNYEADRLNGDEAGQTALVEEIGRHVKGTQRLLLDLNGTSAWLARRLAGMNSTILVPVAPDMNSVLGIKGVERFFAGLQDGDGRPQLPYYLLNQFDASLPLHLDVREVLRQQLGDRLLAVMIRRSPSVAEALAEGMTVMDYAPESPVTEDYVQLAEWVRKRSAPAQATTMRSTRWSER